MKTAFSLTTALLLTHCSRLQQHFNTVRSANWVNKTKTIACNLRGFEIKPLALSKTAVSSNGHLSLAANVSLP